MDHRILGAAVACSALLAAPAARADRVALLPARGGGDAAPRAALDGDLARGLAALGHTLVPRAEVGAAVKARVPDGVADTPEEYRAVGAATRADWVLVGAVDPAVTTARVEIVACALRSGRVESVAREVEKARAQPQVQEMLAALVRPEGIGAGALPWETPGAPPKPIEPPRPVEPAPPPAPAKPVVPPVEGRARVAYPLGAAGETWPPYSGGKRGFLGVVGGFSLPALRPAAPAGTTAPPGTAFTGAVRGGVAVTDLGLELLAELGGNLAGPRALWLVAGARWMFAPAVTRGADGVRAGAPFFLGPEVVAGGFFQLGQSALGGPGLSGYSSGTTAHPVIGVALDLAFALAPWLQLEAGLGNLRWAPVASGHLLTAGASLGASARF